MYCTKSLGLGLNLWVLGQILGVWTKLKSNVFKMCIYSQEVTQKTHGKTIKILQEFFLQIQQKDISIQFK